MWRYAGSLDVRCVRTCVCNPAALKAAEELHARSKGYSTSVPLALKYRPTGGQLNKLSTETELN